ncbi:MAG: cation transporter [Lachnospiraceae bacterium]|nr:cation transporter [Lachnospiraceae bacterium]
MVQTTVRIEGMACGMCEAHIADTIRRAFPGAKKVKASHRKGTAVFVTEAAADEAALRQAFDATGYRVLEVSSEPCVKKGLF